MSLAKAAPNGKPFAPGAMVLDYLVRHAREQTPVPLVIQMATDLRMHPTKLQNLVNALRAMGDVAIEYEGPMKRYTVKGHGSTPWQRRERGGTVTALVRPCITCGQNFYSTHSGNRMCECCRKKS